jgi:ELWxxDGT repeat protein
MHSFAHAGRRLRGAAAIVVAVLVAALLPMLAPQAASAAAPAAFTTVGSLRSVEFAGHRYFFADDDRHGLELWRTDGTAAGTELFIDVNPGDADSDGLFPDSINSDQLDRHYFAATPTALYLVGAVCTTQTCSSARSYTPGIYRVDLATRKLVPVVTGTRYDVIANLESKVILLDFYTDRTYVLDGKTGGLVELTAFRHLNFDVLHRDVSIIAMGGIAYFAAEDADRDIELWRTDGTNAGTRRVKNIRASASSYPASLVAGTSRFYFVADDGFSGAEIWTSDGTEAGTVRLTEHGVGTSNVQLVVNPPSMVTVGDRLYYYAGTTAYGPELWTTTGTRSSVALVRDLGPGKTGAGIKHLAAVGSSLMFFRAGSAGEDVWATRGTSASTVRVAVGTGYTPPAQAYYRAVQNEPAVVAGLLVYTRNNAGAHEIWQTGVVAGTGKRLARHTGLSGRPTQLLPVGSRIFYTVPTKEQNFGPTRYLPRFATITAVTPALTKAPVPKISGVATVGRRLTAVPGAWAPAPVKLTYRWLRSGKAITGATKASYVLTKADAGKKITVRVTGSRGGYATTSKTSAAVTARLALTKTPTPKISGTAGVGKVFTAVPGTWAPAKVTLRYQWLRNGKAIAGATKSRYTIVAADRGKRLSVKVTGSKAGYTSVAKKSATRTVR